MTYVKSKLTDAYIFNLDAGGLAHPEMDESYCKAAYTAVLGNAMKFPDRETATAKAMQLNIHRYVIIFGTEERIPVEN